MRDFNWDDPLWAVVKEDGTFAGCPCRSEEEAQLLADGHEGAVIFEMYQPDVHEDDIFDDDDPMLEVGFDPYEGCYTGDC